MKLKDWIDKIIKNVKENSGKEKILGYDKSYSILQKIIKENLKAFIEDVEVVKIGIEKNKIYLWVVDKE